MKKNIPSVSIISAAAGEDASTTAVGTILLVWMAAFRRPDWPGTVALLGHVGVGKTTTALLISRILSELKGNPFERIREALRIALRGEMRQVLAEAWQAACQAGELPASAGMPVIHWLPYAAEPYDVRGAPRVVVDPSGRAWTISAPPAEVFAALEHEGGVVVVDDLPLAPEDVQRSLLPLLGEGRLPAQIRLGEPFRLRPGWRVVVTGNFPGQAQGARPIPDPIRNRMVILRMEYGALPPETGTGQPDPATQERLARFVREQSPVWREVFGWHPLVVAFLEMHPHFAAPPPDQASVLAFPSLRTLGMVSDILWTVEGLLPDVPGGAPRARLEAYLRAALLGLIGAEAGEALLAFRKAMADSLLPSPLDILEGAGDVPEALDAARAFYLVRAAEAAARLAAAGDPRREGRGLARAIRFLLRLADAFCCRPEALGPVDQMAAALSSLARSIPEFWARVQAADPGLPGELAHHPGLLRILD